VACYILLGKGKETSLELPLPSLPGKKRGRNAAKNVQKILPVARRRAPRHSLLRGLEGGRGDRTAIPALSLRGEGGGKGSSSKKKEGTWGKERGICNLQDVKKGEKTVPFHQSLERMVRPRKDIWRRRRTRGGLTRSTYARSASSSIYVTREKGKENVGGGGKIERSNFSTKKKKNIRLAGDVAEENLQAYYLEDKGRPKPEDHTIIRASTWEA